MSKGDTCYKCGTSSELHIQKHSRKGVPIMICKACKQKMYYEARLKHGKGTYRNPPLEEWIKKANEINQKVINRSI